MRLPNKDELAKQNKEVLKKAITVFKKYVRAEFKYVGIKEDSIALKTDSIVGQIGFYYEYGYLVEIPLEYVYDSRKFEEKLKELRKAKYGREKYWSHCSGNVDTKYHPAWHANKYHFPNGKGVY